MKGPTEIAEAWVDKIRSHTIWQFVTIWRLQEGLWEWEWHMLCGHSHTTWWRDLFRRVGSINTEINYVNTMLLSAGARLVQAGVGEAWWDCVKMSLQSVSVNTWLWERGEELWRLSTEWRSRHKLPPVLLQSSSIQSRARPAWHTSWLQTNQLWHFQIDSTAHNQRWEWH